MQNKSEVLGIIGVGPDVDALLVATQVSLGKLVDAHQALVDVDNEKEISVDVAIQQFIKAASSINDYYNKLLTDLKK